MEAVMADNSFTIKWLDYSTHKDSIIALRRVIFTEELKRDESTLTTPFDPEGLHLGIYDGHRLIAISTSYLFTNRDSYVHDIQLPSLKDGEICVQTTKRGSLVEYRSKGLNEIKEIVTGAQIISTFQPAYFFATLYNDSLDIKLDYYKRKFGFSLHTKLVHEGIEMTVVTSGPENYAFVTDNYGGVAEPKSKELGISLPSLQAHLEETESLKRFLPYINRDSR